MSLDDLLWRRLHLQNVIMKCLSLESLEYAYFIPIVSQLADYWGDRKIACLCKIMSRQVKQHLNHAPHIHFVLSPPFRDLLLSRSRKGKQFIDFLRNYCYDNADDRYFFTREGSSVSKKHQYSHLFFDSNFKNLFQNRYQNPLVESESKSEKSFFLSYWTYFYFETSQKEFSSQKLQMEELIKQQDLEQIFSISFRYKPKGQRITKIGNTY